MKEKTEFDKNLTNFTNYFVLFFVIFDFVAAVINTTLEGPFEGHNIISYGFNIILRILLFKLGMYLTFNSSFKIKKFTNIEADLVKRKIWCVGLALLALYCFSGIANVNSKINEFLENDYTFKKYDMYVNIIKDDEITNKYNKLKEDTFKEVKQKVMLISFINYVAIFAGDVLIIKLQSNRISKYIVNEESEEYEDGIGNNN